MKQIICMILLLATVSSCKRKTMERDEYFTYLSTNEELNVVKEFNKIQYKLKLQPPELLAYKNARKELKTKEEFNAELSYYKDKLNFIFLMEDGEDSDHYVKSSVFNKERYASILAYANTELKNDFMLVQNNKDTLYCSVIHLEPANSLQPVIRLSIGFSDLDPNEKDYTLIFNDNIFSNGPIKFNYPKSLFDQLPELKM